MNLLTPFRRPEYFFRPGQVFRRLLLPIRRRRSEVEVSLPWGPRLRVNGLDRNIGQAILAVGLDDLPLCEILWRLIEPGDLAVDVGANIGMTVSLMLTRVGFSGTVHAFEPHPRTHRCLESNACLWGKGTIPSNLELYRYAVGAQAGKAALHEPDAWEVNSGGVSVRPAADENGALVVEVIRLDKQLPADRPIGVVKVDVEGRQDDVLRGMEGLLRRRQVRDIVFEITRETPLPYEMTCWLEEHGYTCFVIDREFRGPKLRDVSLGAARVAGHQTNLLATIDQRRARRLVAPRGWRCLGHAP